MNAEILSTELMTTQEVEKYLKIDRVTIWDYRKRGILKAYGIGRNVRFKRLEVEASLIELKPVGRD